MRLSSILLLYRLRLRTRLVQELFAVAGIAVGVALLFASQIASTSLDGSVAQLTRGIVGSMRYQIAARSPEGFEERILGEVQSLPGVQAAEPVLEARANVLGPKSQSSVDLIGTDPHFAATAGPLLHHFTATQLASQQAFALPAPIAQSMGLLSLSPVSLQIGGRLLPSFLGAELLGSDIGPLVESPVAIAPLAYAQQLAGLRGRLSRIFVKPAAGDDREVRKGLNRIAAGVLDVRPADFDATLFSQAAAPANQSALLFSAISALVGFLFAFNAILLTVPQRRSLVEDLRLDGYPRRTIVAVLLLDGLVLGAVASLMGLLLGDALSLIVFHANPGYLSFAFPIGSQRIVTWQSIAIATAGGLLAACIGVLVPLARDISSRLTLVAPVRRSRRSGTIGLLSGGVLCLAITTVVLFAAPQAAIFGMVSLVLAALLLLPALVDGVVFVVDRLQRPLRGVAPYLAVVELRSRATRVRSLAIAATGTIAVLGSVAIQGAHANLQRGLDNATHDVNTIAAVWASPAGASNLLATTPFRDTGTRSKVLAGIPGVRSVALYRGSFLDFGGRRTWVIAPPRSARQPVPPSQLVSGDLGRATALLGTSGWAVVSKAIAVERHLQVGQAFTLPAPRPTTFRVAALSTNIGWPPGAIIVNAEDYARAWGSTAASAYNIEVSPGVSPARVRQEVQRTLGPASGLVAETMLQREQRGHATSRQGLSRLTQIATLVLMAAILAMAAAMCALIWQRRERLADMKVDGFGRGMLWRALLAESALLLGAGCSIGAVFGIYGQILLSHALATVTGFPVVYSTAGLVAAGSFLLVVAVAVFIVALPGYLAVRVRPALSLQD
jgi:putative ABC transport system permease protein